MTGGLVLTPQQTILARLASPERIASHVVPILKDEMFNEVEKRIFGVIRSLVEKGIEPNVTVVFFEAKKQNKLSNEEAIEFLKWQNMIVFTEPLETYLSILKNELVEKQISKSILEASQTDKPKLDLAINLINELNIAVETEIENENLVLSLSEVLKFERDSYYHREHNSSLGVLNGVDTGIPELNEFTGGWQKEFIIIAGATSMGKTAMALFHGMQSKKPGIYFNLEMDKGQLARRLIMQFAEGKINHKRLRDGKMTHDEKILFEQIIGRIEQMPFKIIDKAAIGVKEAIAIIKKENKAGRCQWVIIDYLQLMTLEGEKLGTRELEVGTIGRLLKKAQKDLGIPIIALAQLSRAVDSRTGHIPRLSDLRESGSLEQHADTVGFIFRPAYYGLNKDDGSPYTNELIYFFEKHRQGGVGKVELFHNETITSFYGKEHNNSSNSLPLSTKPSKYFYEVEKDEPF